MFGTLFNSIVSEKWNEKLTVVFKANFNSWLVVFNFWCNMFHFFISEEYVVQKRINLYFSFYGVHIVTAAVEKAKSFCYLCLWILSFLGKIVYPSVSIWWLNFIENLNHTELLFFMALSRINVVIVSY